MLHYCVKSFLLSAFSILLFHSSAYSETGEPGGSDKKKRILAEKYFDGGDYLNALQIYNELYEKDSISPYLNYHIGVCKFYIRRYHHEALQHLERSNPKINTEIYYYLGILYHENELFEEAVSQFNRYLNLTERYFTDAEIEQLIQNTFSAQLLLEADSTYIINNLGTSINTKYSEYAPLITADGTKLFFTSRRPGSTGDLKDPYGEYYEDIYFTKLINDKWSEPKQLPQPVNSTTHDACVGLTPEGENLLIYRTNPSLITGDIYLSEFNGSNWSEPTKLDPVINSEDGVEPSAVLSASGDMIIFSSSRPGGFGGKDLYRSVKLPNGKWSLALNLGPNINTPFDEDSPFLHPDGNKLFFSSNGHQNMGGFDIFRSELDSAGHWSKAHNMGSPLNTVYDDIHFVINSDGSKGFFSSSRSNSNGELDIYSIEFVPKEYSYMIRSGKVSNQDGKPIAAKMTLIEISENYLEGKYSSNRLTGKFILLYNPKGKYELVVEAEGYHPETMLISAENTELEIILKPLSE